MMIVTMSLQGVLGSPPLVCLVLGKSQAQSSLIKGNLDKQKLTK